MNFRHKKSFDVPQCLSMACTLGNVFVGQKDGLACFDHEKQVYLSPHAPGVCAMAIGDTKDSLICGDARGHVLNVITGNGTVRGILKRPGPSITALCFQRHDSRILAGDSAGIIYDFRKPYSQPVPESRSNKKLSTSESESPISALVFGPDCYFWAAGKVVGRCGGEGDYTKRMDKDVRMLDCTLTFPFLVIPQGEKIGLYWPLERGCQKSCVTKETVTAIDINPNGATLAAGYSTGRIILWDMRTLSDMKILQTTCQEPVTHLRFDRSGTVLCSVHKPGEITVWQA